MLQDFEPAERKLIVGVFIGMTAFFGTVLYVAVHFIVKFW